MQSTLENQIVIPTNSAVCKWTMPLFYIPGYEKKHSLWCLCIISVVILKVFTFIISEPYRKAVFLHGVHVIPLLH